MSQIIFKHTYSYDEYCSHFILGIIYSRSNLQKFVFLLQDKYKVKFSVSKEWDEAARCLNTYKFELKDASKSPINYFITKYNLAGDKDKKDVYSEIYSLIQGCVVDERKPFQLKDLKAIPSVVMDFDFFLCSRKVEDSIR